MTGKVLDYGCGHGEDIDLLRERHNINIVGYDKFNEKFKDETLLNERYDNVTCNYVFNVIYNLEEHKQVVELLRTLSKNVYISVRSDIKAIKDWEYIAEQDCYKTSRSFQRFYDKQMISKYFGEVEYLGMDGSFKLFKLL